MYIRKCPNCKKELEYKHDNSMIKQENNKKYKIENKIDTMGEKYYCSRNKCKK